MACISLQPGYNERTDRTLPVGGGDSEGEDWHIHGCLRVSL